MTRVRVDLMMEGQRGSNRTNQEFPELRPAHRGRRPGVVVTAVDGNPDNQLGVQNTYDQHGNFVVIDHRNGEFSMSVTSHRQRAGARGGRRAEGQQLGSCGNTGRSTAPHLHWQMMDGPVADRAHALPIPTCPTSTNVRRPRAASKPRTSSSSPDGRAATAHGKLQRR